MERLTKGEVEKREPWNKKFDILGDKVYCIIDDEDRETEMCERICLSAAYDGIFTVSDDEKIGIEFFGDEFWFTDKDEAEARLKELQSK